MQIIASGAMRGARMGKVVAFISTDSGKSAKIVKFTVKQKISFGSHIAVVGSNPVLGEWNPAAALELSWNEGDVWSAEAQLDTADEVDFKFVIVEPEDEIKWIPGDNVILSVPEDASEVLVEASNWDSKTVVIKPIKTKTKVETKVEKKAPEIKKETIASVAAPAVAKSNIVTKATPAMATASPTAATATSSIALSMSMAEIEKMTLPKIKEIMVKMGLETTGKKADLIAKIRTYLQT